MGPPNPAKFTTKKAFSKSAITIEIEGERLLFERHRMNMNLKSNKWNWRWLILRCPERRYIDLFIRIYIFKEAKWTDKVMTLQLRTRLNGEIKDVNQLANKSIRNPPNNQDNKFKCFNYDRVCDITENYWRTKSRTNGIKYQNAEIIIRKLAIGS